MKKVLSVIAIAALSVAFVSCGQSEAEIAAEKAKLDSITAATTALLTPPADTTVVAAPADTTTAATPATTETK